MKYRIQRTDRAGDQLDRLLMYIADDAGDIDVALRYLDRIEEAIMRLSEFPYAGA